VKFLSAKSWDKAITASKKAAQELDQFIDWVNTFTDNVARVLQKGINVSDNIDGEFRDVTLKSGTEQSFKLSKVPQAIIVARSSTPLTAFSWSTRENVPQVTATFTGNAQSDVRLLILY
jgi:hypothetical protein